jgi:hypothetical protein
MQDNFPCDCENSLMETPHYLPCEGKHCAIAMHCGYQLFLQKVYGLAVSTKDIALATLAEETHGTLHTSLILGSIRLFFAKVNAAL